MATRKLPFRDMNLSFEDRIDDLAARMTLKEKISQIMTPSKAIPRLGVPAMTWGGECLHGLVHTGRATQFPMPIGLAATFDPDLIRRVADAIASEARAKHHDRSWWGPDENGVPQPRVGLNFWTPNMNIFRDPRWGRGQETYGEDPFLTGTMASAFVRGLQGDHPKYLKVGACAKHFAVHSGSERLRTCFDARVSKKDLFETYLPAFKALIDGGVESVMATYNRVNGEACPASETLLKRILRETWGFKGHVVGDGGAMSTMHIHHQFTKDKLDSAVKGLLAGCDLCNDGAHGPYELLGEAVRKGLVAETDIDTSLKRILSTQFKLGIYDDPEKVPYTRIGRDVIQCARHLDLARKSALRSVVLLKNNGILPLKPEMRTIGVTGPTAADAEILIGNFYRGVSARLCTILEGIVSAAPEGAAVKYIPGSYSAHPNLYDSGWHIGMLEHSDVTVAVVGLTPLMEGEQGECIGTELGGDRTSIRLPKHQREFIANLKWAKKPVVLVVTGGSPLALEEFHDMADAILHVWYPGEQGGLAVGDILFGRESPSGKLPVTFPASDSQLPPFANYSMKNRTYRYMTEKPLYPFGFGLSYTTFKYSGLKLSGESVKKGGALSAAVTVKNTGKRAGEEVVQLYVSDNRASVAVPRWALKSFTRVALKPGASKTVRFAITPDMLELFNAKGEAVLEPGSFTVRIGGSSPGKRSGELGAPEMATATFRVVG